MGWSIGYDDKRQRDIGYGVPATCDHAGCRKHIHRGLSYVCGGEPYGGDEGCGLFFCEEHLYLRELDDETFGTQLCVRCHEGKDSFEPSPDLFEWVLWKLSDRSWQGWRDDSVGEVTKLRALIGVPDCVCKDGTGFVYECNECPR